LKVLKHDAAAGWRKSASPTVEALYRFMEEMNILHTTKIRRVN
jgi:hypothetical protein